MPNKAQLKKFESDFAKAMKALDKRRQDDDRTFKHRGDAGAYLTHDMLSDRKALTNRQKLVMAYGKGGDTREYSLKDLNQLANAKDRAIVKHKADVTGIPIDKAISSSDIKDKRAAKAIASALLYRITGNILDFRVSASGTTPNAPSHYKVRVRLDSWKTAVSQVKAKNYTAAAQRASYGLVSFDCNCGRYIYWYQYLCTMGNFDIAPGETVFPKVRNKELTGICCKHILKALMTVQQPIVQMRIAKAMQATAVDKDFEKINPEDLSAKEMKELEKAGDMSPTTQAAFKRFTQAAKAFQEKQNQPKTKAAKAKFNKDNEAKMKKMAEENRVAKAAAQTLDAANKELVKQLHGTKREGIVNGLKLMKATNNMDDAGFKLTAEFNGISVDALKGIAKEEGLL